MRVKKGCIFAPALGLTYGLKGKAKRSLKNFRIIFSKGLWESKRVVDLHPLSDGVVVVDLIEKSA